jgi:AcrR family transcriptional regulator
MDQHQQTRILDAAVVVFGEKGYPATTVDDIVAAARIGVGSFYSYFGGKEQCLVGAFDRTAAEARNVVAEAVAAGPGAWASSVCQGMRALLAWIATQPTKAHVTFIDVQTGGAEAVAHYEKAVDDAARFLRLGREQMKPERVLPDSFERTTASGVAWLLHHHISRGEAANVESLFADLSQMILEPYLGEQEARHEIAVASQDRGCA